MKDKWQHQVEMRYSPDETFKGSSLRRIKKGRTGGGVDRGIEAVIKTQMHLGCAVLLLIKTQMHLGCVMTLLGIEAVINTPTHLAL